METAIKCVVYGLAGLVMGSLLLLFLAAAFGPTLAIVYFLIKLAGSF